MQLRRRVRALCQWALLSDPHSSRSLLPSPFQRASSPPSGAESCRPHTRPQTRQPLQYTFIMPLRPVLLQLARLTATAAAVALLATWTASYWTWLEWLRGGRSEQGCLSVSISRGSLTLIHEDPYPFPT